MGSLISATTQLCTQLVLNVSEHSSSKLALIKNKLQMSFGQDRLDILLFCSVERDIVQQLDARRVIDHFDGDNRRLALK